MARTEVERTDWYSVFMGEMAFISEPIEIELDNADLRTISTGLVGQPRAFVWRGRRYGIARILERRKVSENSGQSPGGQVYLRREHFVVEVDGGLQAELYFERTVRSGSRRQRWFLYTIDDGLVDRLGRVDDG